MLEVGPPKQNKITYYTLTMDSWDY